MPTVSGAADALTACLEQAGGSTLQSVNRLAYNLSASFPQLIGAIRHARNGLAPSRLGRAEQSRAPLAPLFHRPTHRLLALLHRERGARIAEQLRGQADLRAQRDRE